MQETVGCLYVKNVEAYCIGRQVRDTGHCALGLIDLQHPKRRIIQMLSVGLNFVVRWQAEPSNQSFRYPVDEFEAAIMRLSDFRDD